MLKHKATAACIANAGAASQFCRGCTSCHCCWASLPQLLRLEALLPPPAACPAHLLSCGPPGLHDLDADPPACPTLARRCFRVGCLLDSYLTAARSPPITMRAPAPRWRLSSTLRAQRKWCSRATQPKVGMLAVRRWRAWPVRAHLSAARQVDYRCRCSLAQWQRSGQQQHSQGCRPAGTCAMWRKSAPDVACGLQPSKNNTAPSSGAARWCAPGWARRLTAHPARLRF